MAKIPIKIRALLKEKGPKNIFKEGEVGEFSKVVLSLVTGDDQSLFVEVRNKLIDTLEGIPEYCIVDIEIVFIASIKNKKRYNNLIVTKITKV